MSWNTVVRVAQETGKEQLLYMGDNRVVTLMVVRARWGKKKELGEDWSESLDVC